MNNNEVNVIIDELYEMVQNARSLPLSADKCIIERDALLDLADDIIAALPENIKEAKTIVSTRSRIICDAQKEAEALIAKAKEQASEIITSANRDAESAKAKASAQAEDIIAKARAKAEEMVENETIYKETEKQCNAMMDKATAQIAELKAASNKYISDSLKNAEKTISASLKDITETREKFELLTVEKKPTNSNNRFDNFFNDDIYN